MQDWLEKGKAGRSKLQDLQELQANVHVVPFHLLAKDIKQTLPLGSTLLLLVGGLYSQ